MDLSVQNLEDLVVAMDDDPESHLLQIYDWDHQRQMSVATWWLGVSASLFVGLLLSSLTVAQSSANKNVLEIGAAFGALALVYGSWRFWRMRGTYIEYIGALS